MATRIEIIYRALARLGEQPLEFESPEAAAAFATNAALEVEDDIQRIAAAIYPDVRASRLNAHPWSWHVARDTPPAVPWTEGEPP